MIKPHGGTLINRVLTGKEQEEARTKSSELPEIEISSEQAKEVGNIAHGSFSPLDGFINQKDFLNILYEKRLANDLPWTIPVALDVSEDTPVKEGDDIALIDGEETPLAIMHVEERYNYDRNEFAKQVYGTTDTSHPGVAKVFGMKDVLLGGKIDLINEPKILFPKYALKPIETRVLFKEKGWRTVVGFQTRNTPHLGHEYLQKTALTFADGVFINPVIGRKKKGDFKDEVILKAYEALMQHYYLRERAVMAILPMEMRYAGPREAIFHAIIRKNFGCTHFIIGRDHAGVSNFYSPFAAQEIFEEFPDIGIVPIFFNSFFYCKKCSGVSNEKTCPHDEEFHITFSGTKIRKMLTDKKLPPEELMRPEVAEIIINSGNPFVE